MGKAARNLERLAGGARHPLLEFAAGHADVAAALWPHALEEYQRALDTIDGNPRIPAADKARRRMLEAEHLARIKP